MMIELLYIPPVSRDPCWTSVVDAEMFPREGLGKHLNTNGHEMTTDHVSFQVKMGHNNLYCVCKLSDNQSSFFTNSKNGGFWQLPNVYGHHHNN